MKIISWVRVELLDIRTAISYAIEDVRDAHAHGFGLSDAFVRRSIRKHLTYALPSPLFAIYVRLSNKG